MTRIVTVAVVGYTVGVVVCTIVVSLPDGFFSHDDTSIAHVIAKQQMMHEKAYFIETPFMCVDRVVMPKNAKIINSIHYVD
jgi:hypothetical protein